jgi:hypothetical protein
VLEGFDHDGEFRRAKVLFTSLEVVDLGGEIVAVQAAENFRKLGSAGVTVRKTIDCIIAT